MNTVSLLLILACCTAIDSDVRCDRINLNGKYYRFNTSELTYDFSESFLPVYPGYYSKCIYPLKTHKLASADCVLPLSCGDQRFTKLDSTWYGEEFGVCWALHSPPRTVFNFSLHPNFPLDVLTPSLEYDRSYVVNPRFDEPSKFIINNIVVYRQDPTCYTFRPRDCLISQSVVNRIRVVEEGDDAGFHVSAPDDSHIKSYCAGPCLPTLTALLQYLNLGLIDSSCPEFPLESRSDNCKFYFNSTHGRAMDIFDPDLADYTKSPIIKCTNPVRFSDVNRKLVIAYSNPIVASFKSALNYILLDLGFILKFFIQTVLEILWILFLDLLDVIIVSVPYVMELFIIYLISLVYTGDLIRSLTLTLPIYFVLISVQIHKQGL